MQQQFDSKRPTLRHPTRKRMDPTLEHAGPSASTLLSMAPWARTALGPIEAWSRSLRAVAHLVTDAALPMIQIWGPQRILVYNTAFAEWEPIYRNGYDTGYQAGYARAVANNTPPVGYTAAQGTAPYQAILARKHPVKNE